MIMMPFTYSVANGIMFGILSWVFLKLITGKMKEIPPCHVDLQYLIRT